MGRKKGDIDWVIGIIGCFVIRIGLKITEGVAEVKRRQAIERKEPVKIICYILLKEGAEIGDAVVKYKICNG